MAEPDNTTPGLDFSILTDDQLVSLIRLACQEAGRRSALCQAAAEAAMLDEAERARIAREAAAKEASRIRAEQAARVAESAARAVRVETEGKQIAELWAFKDEMGSRISAILRPKRAVLLKIWERDGDKRIYLGGGYGDNDLTYHHTGSSKFKPGTIECATADLHITKADLPRVKQEILPLLVEICRRYDAIRIPVPAWEEPA